MAQRTGAERFLAPRTKAAGSRAILGLAVAALLAVSGCGGGSGSEAASAPSSKSTAGEGKTPPGEARSESPSNGGAKPGAGKQGPPISVPKGVPEQAPTAAQRAEATIADIALWSPGISSPSAGADAISALPFTNTCDGEDSWPELRWRGVPAGTSELVLFVIGLQPVDEALFFDWVVAGLDPKLESIEAGELPKGAIVGRNGFGEEGYSICPTAKVETFFFALYALPRKLSPKQGFDPKALRKEVLEISGNAGIMSVAYAPRG